MLVRLKSYETRWSSMLRHLNGLLLAIRTSKLPSEPKMREEAMEIYLRVHKGKPPVPETQREMVEFVVLVGLTTDLDENDPSSKGFEAEVFVRNEKLKKKARYKTEIKEVYRLKEPVHVTDGGLSLLPGNIPCDLLPHNIPKQIREVADNQDMHFDAMSASLHARSCQCRSPGFER